MVLRIAQQPQRRPAASAALMVLRIAQRCPEIARSLSIAQRRHPASAALMVLRVAQRRPEIARSLSVGIVPQRRPEIAPKSASTIDASFSSRSILQPARSQSAFFERVVSAESALHLRRHEQGFSNPHT